MSDPKWMTVVIYQRQQAGSIAQQRQGIGSKSLLQDLDREPLAGYLLIGSQVYHPHSPLTELALDAVATAEQLARVAANAAADGRQIDGILVADPDSADHTTGRAPQIARPERRIQPTRVTGMTREIRR